MDSTLRSVLAGIALLGAATWLVPWGGFAWATWFLNDHIYSVPFGWLSWPGIISWSYYTIAFLVLGAVLQLLAPSPRSTLMALALGSIYSVFWFVRSSYHFSDAAPLFNYFWVFGELLVPPLASYGGAVLAAKLFSNQAISSAHGA